eukprot:1221797-Amorphochlora_amoeboformis.AAC.1
MSELCASISPRYVPKQRPGSSASRHQRSTRDTPRERDRERDREVVQVPLRTSSRQRKVYNTPHKYLFRSSIHSESRYSLLELFVMFCFVFSSKNSGPGVQLASTKTTNTPPQHLAPSLIRHRCLFAHTHTTQTFLTTSEISRATQLFTVNDRVVEWFGQRHAQHARGARAPERAQASRDPGKEGKTPNWALIRYHTNMHTEISYT